jgi:hypothetical protein
MLIHFVRSLEVRAPLGFWIWDFLGILKLGFGIYIQQ